MENADVDNHIFDKMPPLIFFSWHNSCRGICKYKDNLFITNGMTSEQATQ